MLKKNFAGSFFDFLIPAFVRSSNKADPEGPLDRPRDVRPKVKLNKNRIDARIDPRFPVNTGGLASIGKKYALKKYDQFALNTSCF